MPRDILINLAASNVIAINVTPWKSQIQLASVSRFHHSRVSTISNFVEKAFCLAKRNEFSQVIVLRMCSGEPSFCHYRRPCKNILVQRGTNFSSNNCNILHSDVSKQVVPAPISYSLRRTIFLHCPMFVDLSLNLSKIFTMSIIDRNILVFSNFGGPVKRLY